MARNPYYLPPFETLNDSDYIWESKDTSSFRRNYIWRGEKVFTGAGGGGVEPPGVGDPTPTKSQEHQGILLDQSLLSDTKDCESKDTSPPS